VVMVVVVVVVVVVVGLLLLLPWWQRREMGSRCGACVRSRSVRRRKKAMTELCNKGGTRWTRLIT